MIFCEIGEIPPFFFRTLTDFSSPGAEPRPWQIQGSLGGSLRILANSWIVRWRFKSKIKVIKPRGLGLMKPLSKSETF